MILLLALVSPLSAQEDTPEDFLGNIPVVDRSDAQEEEVEECDEDDEECEVEECDEDDEECEEEEPLPRITFRVPFSDAQGGGIASGSAGLLEQRPDSVLASGGVVVKYRDLQISAEEIEVESETKIVHARGNVVLDQGPKRLSAESLRFDLGTETGTFYEAKASVDPDIYFIGEEITKTGEDSYDVKNGMFTSCEDDVPEWSFRLARATIDLGGYARAYHTTMRVKKLPLLYFPYVLWPAKQDRVSGFLVPNIGYSELRGAHLGLAYFQTLGRSYDTTFYADLYGEEYYGLGNEFRYRPSEGTEGIFEGYAIDDPIDDELRWKVSLKHESNDLPLGLRGVIDYVNYSDFDFFQDFERDFGKVTVRSLQSVGFLSGNWGQHSVTFLVEDRESFFSSGTVNQRQLPELEYRLRQTQIGSLPLYLEFLGSAHYFEVAPEDGDSVRYGRTDLFPQLTVPLSTLPWLSASVTAGARATHYEESIDETGTEFTGEGIDRFFTSAQAQMVGPSVSRIYETPISFFEKFKHVIEPRWSYNFVDSFEEQAFVPRFDEVDILRASNTVGFALVNRVLAKPKDEELHGSAREIFSFEVGQAFSLNDDQPLQFSSDGLITSKESPITAQARFNPSLNLSVDSQVSYSTLFNGISSTSLSGTVNFGGDYQNVFGLTWFSRRNVETDESTSEQLRIGTGIDIVRNRLRWESQINYNVKNDLLQQQRHFLIYTGNCYGVRLEFTDFQSTNREDTDIRLAISLKNVGTFLDLTSGQSEGFR